MRKRWSVVVPLVVGLVSLGCAVLGGPTATVPPATTTAVVEAPSDTPGAGPVLPTDTPGTGPEATATIAPSATPELPTFTPFPTSLNATGPYVAFNGAGGVWLSNPDGSGLTQLTSLEASGNLRHAISPLGDRLALVLSTEGGLDLRIVRVPSGETETTINLTTLTGDDAGADPTSAGAFALYAMRDFTSVAWQPGEGRLLAFVGAMNGPTADLFLYDTQTQAISQLTDGPSQAVFPEWSPDGQYILHAGVSWVPPFGGAIIGPNQFDGVWAVRAADGAVIEQTKPAGNRPNFVGWQDEGHYWTFDGDVECFAQNLRLVDVASGTDAPGLSFSFYGPVAQAPGTGALLLSGAPGCPTALGEGVFLLPSGATMPTRLLEQRAFEVRWLPESEVFLAYPEGLVSGDGQLVYAPPVEGASFAAAVSRAGYQAWEVIENQTGRVVVKAPGGDWQTVIEGDVAHFIWDPVDGQTVLIVLWDGELFAATAPDFEPRAMGSVGGAGARAAWVPPAP